MIFNNKFEQFFKRIIILSFFCLLIFGNFALAYRPFGTEDTGVAGTGVFQAELSFDHLKWNDGSKEQSFLFVPIYGVNDNLEFSVEFPYMIHYPNNNAHGGAGDISLVAKYLLAEENGKMPALTLKGTVKLDNGNYDAGFGSGDKDYTLFVVGSKTFGDIIIINTNIGYTFVGKSKNTNFRDIFLYGISFDYELTKKVHLLAEVNGNRHPDSGETEDPRNWLIGIIYKFSDKLIFDVASKWGLSKSTPDWNITSGLSLTF